MVLKDQSDSLSKFDGFEFCFWRVLFFDEMGWLDRNMASRCRVSSLCQFPSPLLFTFLILLTINPSDSKPFADETIMNLAVIIIVLHLEFF